MKKESYSHLMRHHVYIDYKNQLSEEERAWLKKFDQAEFGYKTDHYRKSRVCPLAAGRTNSIQDISTEIKKII